MSSFAETYRRLAALMQLASGEEVTQRSLASLLGISLGSANALLRHLEGGGLVAVNRSAAAQVLRYALTGAGRIELRSLATQFASEAGGVLAGLRAEIQRQAGRLRAGGRRRVLLCGTGPLADMAASALLNAGFKLVGVVSTDAKGGGVAGVKMRPFSEIGKVNCDVAVAVTSRDARALRRRLGRRVPVAELISGEVIAESGRGR